MKWNLKKKWINKKKDKKNNQKGREEEEEANQSGDEMSRELKRAENGNGALNNDASTRWSRHHKSAPKLVNCWLGQQMASGGRHTPVTWLVWFHFNDDRRRRRRLGGNQPMTVTQRRLAANKWTSIRVSMVSSVWLFLGLGSFGILWEFHWIFKGSWWDFLWLVEMVWDFHGVTWDSLGSFWDYLGFFDILWDPLGFPGPF